MTHLTHLTHLSPDSPNSPDSVIWFHHLIASRQLVSSQIRIETWRHDVHILRMSRRMYTKAEYDHMKRQRAVAFAKYYEERRRAAENTQILLNFITATIPRVDGELQRPVQLPPHITSEFFEMAERLNKEYTCPICLDLTARDTVHITWCGHILCSGCYEDLKESAIIREKPKCPMCRKDI